jgi:hypothetical protein
MVKKYVVVCGANTVEYGGLVESLHTEFQLPTFLLLY